MSMDAAVFNDLADYYNSWLENHAQPFIYMPRYTGSNMPFGLCTRCIDQTTHQITDSKCPVCYGTGFTGGYDAPVTGPNSPYQRVYGFLMSNSLVTDWQPTGPVANEQDQLLYVAMDATPAISDLIVDQDGFRYRVGTNIKSWNFMGKNLGFVITVFQQSQNNVIYTVPIPNSNPSNVSIMQGQRTAIEVIQPYQSEIEITQPA